MKGEDGLFTGYKSDSEPVLDVVNTVPVSSIKTIKMMAEVEPFQESELEENKILHSGASNSKLLNVFRDVRTKLVQIAEKNNFILMVTSTCSGGGSSFAAVNIAAAFALDQSKTSLLIDCNLYQPNFHRLIKTHPDYGLTDYLVDASLKVDDIIYPSGVPRLRIIPVGSHIEGGAEHFTSERMKRFLENVRERYPDRFIVLEAPPIGISAEARILADLCDYSILIVPSGKSSREQIKSAVSAIDERKFAGIMFNN